MSMNVSSLSGIMYCVATDAEYQRIIRELRALGLEPTGDKAADKAKLEAAKSAQKAENKEEAVFQPIDAGNETTGNQAFNTSDEIKSNLAADTQNMTGADQIAQLNRFSLLGR